MNSARPVPNQRRRLEMENGGWNGTLTPTFSRRMGEGERFDAWAARLDPESSPSTGGPSLSRRTGEGQGEGYFGNLRELRKLWCIVVRIRDGKPSFLAVMEYQPKGEIFSRAVIGVRVDLH
jgi:hypothetical protein